MNIENTYLLKALNETKCVIIVKKYTMSGDMRRSRLEYISPNADILGMNVEALMKGYRLTEDYLHPDDREAFMDAVALARDEQNDFAYSLRIVGDDGRIRQANISILLTDVSEHSFVLEFVLKEVDESDRTAAAASIREEDSFGENPVNDIPASGKILSEDDEAKELVRSVISLEDVYSTIVDLDGKILMPPVGPEADMGSFYDLFERPIYKDLYEEIKETLGEHKKPIYWEMEDGNPDSRISAAPIIVDGQQIATWILCAYNKVQADRLFMLYENQWVIARLISEYLNSLYTSEKKSSIMKTAEAALESEMKQREIITETLSMMAADIDGALENMFTKTGKLLNLDSIILYTVKEPGSDEFGLRKYWNVYGALPDETIDTSWKRMSYIAEEQEAIERGGFIIDHNNITNRIRVGTLQGRMRAVMVYPIVVNDALLGWFLFLENKSERVWTESEVLFTKELSRLVKRMLSMQIGEGNLRKVNHFLLDTYNYISVGIFIRDIYTGKVLFSNKKLNDMLGYNFTGKDSRALLTDLHDKFDNIIGMRNNEITNNKVMKWRRYIDALDAIVDITEIQSEWLNGEPASFIIMRLAQD